MAPRSGNVRSVGPAFSSRQLDDRWNASQAGGWIETRNLMVVDKLSGRLRGGEDLPSPGAMDQLVEALSHGKLRCWAIKDTSKRQRLVAEEYWAGRSLYFSAGEGDWFLQRTTPSLSITPAAPYWHFRFLAKEVIAVWPAD